MQWHVLTFNWHDPYLHMFAQTGFRISVGDWMRRADGTTGWDAEKRPLPENLTLLKAQAEAVALLKQGDCDVVLCHTLQDLNFVAPFDVPTIYLTHNALQNDGMNGAGTMARLQREVGTFLAARKGVFAAISPMKLTSWGMDGFVVRPGINLEDYAGYTGEKAAALSVGNLFVERDHMLGYRFLKEILDGAPHQLVGENPKLPQAKKAENWEDLKAHFRRYRAYVNATVETFEDGYNLGMLEAMATGMPVVSYANATSPIRDGENGYISSDTGYLKERVLALLNDLELATALGQKARETVAAQFSVAAFVEKWQEIVAESIRRKNKKATKHPRRGIARCAGEIAGTRIRGREAPSDTGVAELAEYTGEDVARAFLKRWKGPVRLNLGCGEDRRQGYINVDAYVSSADLQMDVFDLPLDDGVADEIFSSHMLEHLGKHEVPRVLKTWHRVLKPGGILRLNVPDLSWVVENWLRLPEAQRWGWALDTIFGLQTHPGEYHKTGFTADRIRGLLSWAGFAQVQVSHIDSHGQRCLWVEAKRPEALETKPRVSIVMPLFNKVDYTRACLEGLEAVRGAAPFEVILVDNGSTDGTRALLDGVENRPGYRVVRSAENLGFARGNNAGAQVARGDCLLFLNNDTVPHSGWLEAMVAELESDAGIGIVGARLLYPDTGRIQHAGLELINGVPDHVHRHAEADAPEVNRPRDLDMVTGACLLIRKELFDRLGGFDTGYVNGVEDVDLCLRARDLGYRVRYCPKAVLDHHEGTSAGRYDHVRPNLERFVQRWNGRFDAQGRFVPQAGTRLRGVWEGTQFVYHSLSLVNMALCAELIKAGCDLSLKPYEPATFGPEADVARYGPLAGRLNAALDGAAQFHVRHMWPPDLTPPPEGHWVVIQPWEYGRIPARWVQPIQDGVDEVWVPSAYAKQCYVDSGVDADRVQVIPNGVHTDVFHTGAEPLVLDTEKTFKFLYVGGAIYRKGIDVLLEVYRRAFSRKDDVCLVIKTMGDATFYKKQSAAKTIREIQADPDAPEIVHIDSDLSDADMAGLYAACDCLVHPYRGEGFGLPVAEALSCGLPVIVTKGGACDDFCSADWAHFVPAVRKEVRYEEETAGAAWVLEPDREVLADRMKAAVADPEAGRRMGQRGSVYVREHLTWAKAAAQVMARLRALQERPVRRLQQAHLVDVFVLSDEAGDVPDAIARFTEAPTRAVAGAGLNAAWRQGAGACVALVRRDVVATEDYLDHMIAHFEADDTLAMVAPCLPVAEGEQAVKAKYQSTKRELQRFAKRLYLREKGTCVDVASVVGACAVVRRDVLEAFGGFDGGFLTPAFLDDLARRCRQAGLRVVCARDVFVHCEDRAPDEGEVRERRAVALLETGDGHRARGEADAALAQYRAALEAKEDYLEAALICSAALLEQNRPKEAADIFRKFLAKHPDSSRLHNYLGRCLFVAGEDDRGRAEFERAIALDPNFGEAYSNLGVLLWEQGQLDAALERMNRAAELAPQSPDVIYNIGMIYAQLGQAKQATEVLQLYLELSPDDLHARTYLAVLLLENGAAQDGVTELERVLAADPNCEAALRVLAQLQAAAEESEGDG